MSSARFLIPLAGSVLALGAIASSAVVAAPASAAHPPTVRNYHALELRLPVARDAVPGAPAGFVPAMRHELRAAWAGFDDDPGCKKVPLITVEKVSSAGFAAVGYNDDPKKAHAEACRGAGGGTAQFWARRDGVWKKVFEGQDVPTCHRLRRYDMPSSIVGHRCYDAAAQKTVRYHHA